MSLKWLPVAAPGVPDGLIVFDGDCVLCTGWVRFVVARDGAERFSFAPVDGVTGRDLCLKFGVDPADPQSNIVFLDGVAHFKSDAALAVLASLPGWRGARLLRFLPRGFRDRIYDVIARNRYRLFGRRQDCLVPTPDLRRRILR